MSERIAGLSVEHRVSQKNPSEVSICCPFCSKKGLSDDVHFHLSLNVSKGVFKCHRCEESGTAWRLRDFISLGSTVDSGQFSKIRAKLLKIFQVRKTDEHDLDLVSWPISKKATPIAFDYMRKRRFSLEELTRYGVRVGRSFFDTERNYMVRRWSGRVIFPYLDRKRRVTYLVGRSYDNASPKYLNSYGDKSVTLYGVENVDGLAIVCEGLISKINAERTSGIPSVCTLGKMPSHFQLHLLRKAARDVMVCLDGTKDVTDRLRHRINRMYLSSGFKVWEIKLPLGRDPDDCKDDFPKFVRRARRVFV